MQLKTKELILQLQEADPTGEGHVFAGDEVYSVEVLPFYYDGQPDILILNENEKRYYNVIGIRQITSKDYKIRLNTLGMEDVLYDTDCDEMILQGDEKFLERAAKVKAP